MLELILTCFKDFKQWGVAAGYLLVSKYLEIFKKQAGEMTQQLRALTALPKVLSSIPSFDMVAYNHLYWNLMSPSGVCPKTASVFSKYK